MSLAGEVLARWAPIIRNLELRPGIQGRFEVALDGETIFSKAELGRHASPGEIEGTIEKRIGKPLAWREGH